MKIPNNDQTYEVVLECEGCHRKDPVRRWKSLEMVNEFVKNSYDPSLLYRCEDCVAKKVRG